MVFLLILCILDVNYTTVTLEYGKEKTFILGNLEHELRIFRDTVRVCPAKCQR